MNPFSLSAPEAIDPAYCASAVLPCKNGLSLWSAKQGGPFWIYSPGSLEAWLFDRTRREAFSTCLHVGHPGRYQTYQPMLYARRRFVLAAVPTSVPCRLYFGGLLHWTANKRIVVHASGTARPHPTSADLAPFLSPGENLFKIRITADGEPPVFLMDSTLLQSDGEWEVSVDEQTWARPRCFPFEGDQCFPHQEELPELPVSLSRDQDGTYQAGVEVLGRVAVEAGGEGSVSVFAGESREEALSTEDNAREQVVPVLKVAGDGRYSTETKLAFRHLRLAPGPGVEIHDASVSAAFYPAQYRGAFACSDRRLTSIWMHATYTLRACMQLTFVDGLKRDRLPWVGDLYVCNLGNFHSFFEKAISEYSLAALAGQYPAEADLNGTITYSLFWVMALRDHALHFGDSTFLQSLLPGCRRLLSEIGRKADETGLLPTDRFRWVYVDWAEVPTKGTSSFLSFLYIMALDAAAQLHELTGDRAVAGVFARQADALRAVCRELFWDPGRKVFVDHAEAGRQGTHFGRQSNALAVLSGVCAAAQRPDLLRGVFMNTLVAPVGTPYMLFFEARALAMCGARGEMAAMIREYWGSMLDAGGSTFWEAHNQSLEGTEHYAFYGRKFGKSLCHAWSSGPLHLLSADLFGLQPLKLGWKEFSLDPLPCGLEWACTETPTPQGPIRIRMERGETTVRFPQGTTLVSGSGEMARRLNGPAELVLRRDNGEA